MSFEINFWPSVKVIYTVHCTVYKDPNEQIWNQDPGIKIDLLHCFSYEDVFSAKFRQAICCLPRERIRGRGSREGSKNWAGIFKKSMGARHRGGIGFSYRPARLHRLAEFIPWHQFRGPIGPHKHLKVRALVSSKFLCGTISSKVFRARWPYQEFKK